MADKRDVVMALSYYAPYVSGLTEAARLVAEGLVAEGRRVAVVTSRHDPALPQRESINGVEVIRTPVVARIGKAVISPTLATTAAREARGAAMLNLHLPLPDAGLVALLARHPNLVITYQCDADEGSTLSSRAQAVLLDRSHRMALRRARVVCPSSADYALHSRLSDLLAWERSVPISPPTRVRTGEPTFRQGTGLHVGFVGRIVEEKGLPYLVDGFRAYEDPDARLLIAGDPERVAGGSVIDQLTSRIEEDPRIRVLGFLDEEALGDLYASIDTFAFPSINSFEAFGIAQVEAMRAGVPVIASDLPGVREPVRLTGFGTIVARRDPLAITRALREIAERWTDAEERRERAAAVSELYSVERSVQEYEELIEGVKPA